MRTGPRKDALPWPPGDGSDGAGPGARGAGSDRGAGGRARGRGGSAVRPALPGLERRGGGRVGGAARLPAVRGAGLPALSTARTGGRELRVCVKGGRGGSGRGRPAAHPPFLPLPCPGMLQGQRHHRPPPHPRQLLQPARHGRHRLRPHAGAGGCGSRSPLLSPSEPSSGPGCLQASWAGARPPGGLLVLRGSLNLSSQICSAKHLYFLSVFKYKSLASWRLWPSSLGHHECIRSAWPFFKPMVLLLPHEIAY